MESTYDIFISYRRDGGAQYDRIFQLMLSQRGYRVFLDYDELKEGVFGKRIKAAIKAAPVFMLVLLKDSLDRCKNENDWVREEILYAKELQKKIVPVNPDIGQHLSSWMLSNVQQSKRGNIVTTPRLHYYRAMVTSFPRSGNRRYIQSFI